MVWQAAVGDVYQAFQKERNAHHKWHHFQKKHCPDKINTYDIPHLNFPFLNYQRLCKDCARLKIYSIELGKRWKAHQWWGWSGKYFGRFKSFRLWKVFRRGWRQGHAIFAVALPLAQSLMLCLLLGFWASSAQTGFKLRFIMRAPVWEKPADWRLIKGCHFYSMRLAHRSHCWHRQQIIVASGGQYY